MNPIYIDFDAMHITYTDVNASKKIKMMDFHRFVQDIMDQDDNMIYYNPTLRLTDIMIEFN